MVGSGGDIHGENKVDRTGEDLLNNYMMLSLMLLNEIILS